MTKHILFTPSALPNGVTLQNRFVLSPMVTNSSTAEGFVTQDDLDYACRRAKSAPLQITGAAYIDEYGQLFEFGLSCAKDADITGLATLAQAMKSQGAKAILQLTHAGRFASHTLTKHDFVYGPSAMHLHSPKTHEVKALTSTQLQAIVESYAAATSRAIQAGFDGIEISSAQRLLIQTFFSTFSNERSDAYGCNNLATRSQFGLDIVQAVQKVITQEAPKDFIFGFRATPEETRGHQIGYSIEEFIQFMESALDVANLDYLAIASWGRDIFRNRVRGAGSFFDRLVNQVIHEHFDGRLPIMATGGINTPEKVKEALEHADFVGASTPLIVDPEFLQKIKDGREADINFNIKHADLTALAIPQASFKDIVPLMDYGESLPQEARKLFEDLAKNYHQEKP